MMIYDDLKIRFQMLLADLLGVDVAASGRHPSEFLTRLAPVLERRGLLGQFQNNAHWQHCEAGDWCTAALSATAVELGVTVLEIEAVYRLTYGGKP